MSFWGNSTVYAFTVTLNYCWLHCCTLFLFWTPLPSCCLFQWLHNSLWFVRGLYFHWFFRGSSGRLLALLIFGSLPGERRFSLETIAGILLSNLNTWRCLWGCGWLILWGWCTVAMFWTWPCITLQIHRTWYQTVSSVLLVTLKSRSLKRMST